MALTLFADAPFPDVEHAPAAAMTKSAAPPARMANMGRPERNTGRPQETILRHPALVTRLANKWSYAGSATKNGLTKTLPSWDPLMLELRTDLTACKAVVARASAGGRQSLNRRRRR
jgi:hypothetical protein